eukprot:TRINITY_DN846_c0_g1_i1.p1 TRINITY_DN846_c0_g1~~TRINITY_DN846_c0_g1_i1.p1  ORF type:complete len:608 (-),score=168.88 TRINITY_DN846_c0_g1_i1:61-1692(-)
MSDSRFIREFTVLEEIGKGGFASVILARNKLDGKSYAIKKVDFSIYNRDSTSFLNCFSESELLDVLREVKILSSCEHPNIVRYYTAWMEKNEEINCETDQFLQSQLFGRTSTISPEVQFLYDSNVESDIDSGCSIDSLDCCNFKVGSNSDEYLLLHSGNDNEVSFDEGDEIEIVFDSICVEDIDDSNFKYIIENKTPELVRRASSIEPTVIVLDESIHSTNSHSEISNSPTRKIVQDRLEYNGSVMSKFQVLNGAKYSMYIQMQYCSNLCLGQYINAHGALPENIIIHIMRQIVDALVFLHKKGIAHRDVKPENIFLFSDCDSIDSDKEKETDINQLRAVLGDFGLSRFIPINTFNEKEGGFNYSDPYSKNVSGLVDISKIRDLYEISNSTATGTQLFFAPEILKGETATQKSDIYSLALTMYLCMCGFNSYTDKVELIDNFRNGNIPSKIGKSYPLLMPLIKEMMVDECDRRISSFELSKKLVKFEKKNQIAANVKMNVLKKQLLSMMKKIDSSNCNAEQTNMEIREQLEEIIGSLSSDVES